MAYMCIVFHKACWVGCHKDESMRVTPTNSISGEKTFQKLSILLEIVAVVVIVKLCSMLWHYLNDINFCWQPYFFVVKICEKFAKSKCTKSYYQDLRQYFYIVNFWWLSTSFQCYRCEICENSEFYGLGEMYLT